MPHNHVVASAIDLQDLDNSKTSVGEHNFGMLDSHVVDSANNVKDLENGKSSVDDSTITPSTIGSTSTNPGPGPPPDGGLAGWTRVLGSFFALFCTFGWFNA